MAATARRRRRSTYTPTALRAPGALLGGTSGSAVSTGGGRPPRRKRRSAYNVRPRGFTRKRTILLVVVLVFTFMGIDFGRVVAGLAKATGQTPIQVIGGMLSGGKDSSVNQSTADLRRINIAMYGYGGADHDGGYLTDSIMVVSIQPRADGKPPTVAEISLPRDWYVPISLRGGQVTDQRVNYAYAAGMTGLGPDSSANPRAGAAVADPELEKLLGINIDHYVSIDFSAFQQAVDAVGGVDVDVPHTFTDTQYPAGECAGAHPNCAFETVHFDQGMTHLNGAQALIFARSRHGDNGEGSDFARSHRQQLIIEALQKKVVSLGGIGSLPDLVSALGDNVSTDLTVSDMESLYSLVKDVQPAQIRHVSVDNTNFLYDCGYPTNCGAYYLYAHDRTGKSLHQYINDLFLPDYVTAERARVTIEDGSGSQLNASTRWAALFTDVGLTCKDGGTVAVVAKTQVIDSSGGRYTNTAKWLAAYFGVTVTTVAPPSVAPTSITTSPAPASITVIIGNASEKTFTDLNGSVSF